MGTKRRTDLFEEIRQAYRVGSDTAMGALRGYNAEAKP